MRARVPALLSLAEVCVSFGSPADGHTVLSDISFDVPDGEFLCIVGPSGCGKTTLVRLLAGLLAPSGGQILFQGRPLAGTSRDRAIVFQDYSKALLPWRTVDGNIALSLEACGIAEPERRERIGALLAKMRLEPAAGRFPSQLSGGPERCRHRPGECQAIAPA